MTTDYQQQQQQTEQLQQQLQQLKQQSQQHQQLQQLQQEKKSSKQTDKQQQLLAKISQLTAENQALSAKSSNSGDQIEQIKAMRQQVAANKQSYAAGVSLGRDILQLQKRNEALGEVVDRKILLQGIQDAFSGDYQLDQQAIAQALRGANQRVENRRDKLVKQEQNKGQRYLEKFKRRKGVKQAKEGFYYLIVKAGHGQLASQQPITIMVKESLVDGTVVNDMFASNTVTSRLLADYPPLFQQAIRLLQKGGEIELAVPPALAYGDNGYPPKVPPAATMVYRLRVVK